MSDTPSEKPKIIPTRTAMPEQDAKVRATNFEEVNLGYSEEDALREAERCLICKKPLCVAGCPVEIDIPAFIDLIKQGDPGGAIKKLKEKNSLPAICGRVCPQEEQCEKNCVIGKKFEPVAIGRLERYAADWAMSNDFDTSMDLPEPTGKKIAIVGAGPAGLTAAGDLAMLGHKVVIYEALHTPGGVLVYGIPEFRLPKGIVAREVKDLEDMGVEIKCNMVVGKSITIQQLKAEGFDAIFIGSGAGFPNFLGVPGENLNGVYSANEFLTRVNLMKGYLFPEQDTPVKVGKNVAVFGAGNTAMDAARTALRLGADNVYIIYRRGKEQIPARAEEVHHAEDEGIIFKLLTNPIAFHGEEGFLSEVECMEMELGEPDESGRRSPVPVKGSEFKIAIDIAIIAVGTSSNPIIPSATPELELNKWGYIIAEDETGATSIEGVYAGGDIVSGAATVISAAGAGKKAARAIHDFVMSK